LLTEHELAASTDCFAIEFNDMKQPPAAARQGCNYAAGVEQVFYRAQVEHDLRAKLLRLRQKASGVLSDSNLLRRLMLDSVPPSACYSAMPWFARGGGARQEARHRRARARTSRHRPRAVSESLLDIREERLKPRDMEPVALLAAYMQGISVVIDAVDRLEK